MLEPAEVGSTVRPVATAPASQPVRREPAPEVDVTRLLAGLRRTPHEWLDHAVQVARVMQRLRAARRIGPLLPR